VRSLTSSLRSPSRTNLVARPTGCQQERWDWRKKPELPVLWPRRRARIAPGSAAKGRPSSVLALFRGSRHPLRARRLPAKSSSLQPAAA
jgi:hypothetical protein